MLPPLLVDVNIAVDVVEHLRSEGCDALRVEEMGWADRSDRELLAHALELGRFLFTHDADFGRLAVAEGRPFHGILRLRPGDDPPEVVIAGMGLLIHRDIDWIPGTIATFHYRGGRLRLRRPLR